MTYKVLRALTDLEDELNDAEAEGWSVVAMSQLESGVYTVILHRSSVISEDITIPRLVVDDGETVTYASKPS